jgi:hypothetical protein
MRISLAHAVRVACLSTGLALAAPPARAGVVNLVTDGTFQATTLTGAGGYLCGTGSACVQAMTDWTSTCSSSGCTGSSTPSSLLIAGSNGSAWNGGRGLYGTIANAPLGGNAIAIDGDTAYSTTLSQVISGLVVGKNYLLSFYQAASQQVGLSGATTEQWAVTFGTTKTSTTMNNASQSSVPWSLQTMNFTATAVQQTLTFLAQGTPNGEPPVVLLSDVSLTVVPEPATFALTAAGLLSLALLRKKPRPS